MTEEKTPSTGRGRQLLITAGLIILAFGIGAVWQGSRASRLADELRQTRTDLGFLQLEATLGAATLEAQRGAFEVSRLLASDFFSGLQDQIGQATTDAARRTLTDILAERDAVITDLSRADAQVGMRLATLFLHYRTAMRQMNGSEPPAPARNPDEAAAPR
jgi:hypothetical protein